MMKVTIVFLALLATTDATGSLRGEAEVQAPPIACILKGGTSQAQCDATSSENGSTCVWCSLSSYGVCVDDSIAVQIKQAIPGLTCDDEDGDDDEAPATDDKAPDPSTDDNVAPNDDSVPDDYWECIEKFDKKEDCIGGGCAWCDNKGGYGVCMDAKSAETFDDHVWYTCTMPSSLPLASTNGNVGNPSDLACLLSSTDESSCQGTNDSDGQPCEWCSLQGFPVCMNADQAQIAEQVGGSCGNKQDEATKSKELDPYDPTCLAVTIQGDESSCKATMDTDGNPCEWCSIQGYEICMNSDQAELALQVGGSCGANANAQEQAIESATKKLGLSDPNDPTCLFATLQQDESVCKETMDSDGKPCEWCSLQGYEFCADVDQAQIAEQAGASCDERISTSIS